VIVAKKLLVRGHPVSKAEVQKRCELEFSKYILRKLLVIHGRHDVSIEKIKFLDNPKHKEANHGDGEKDGHAEAIHESDVHSAQNTRVLVVHEVDGSLINRDIALDRGALGFSALAPAAAMVKTSEKDA